MEVVRVSGTLKGQEEWQDMYEKGSTSENVSGHGSSVGLEIMCALEGREGGREEWWKGWQEGRQEE